MREPSIRRKMRAGAAAGMAPTPRRPGRPRSEARSEDILDVTLRILAQQGYARLRVDEIVARARISKGTIYRRWPTKEELVVAAFDRLPELKIVDRGSLIEELLELAAQYDRILHQTPLASVLPGLISEAAHNKSLAQQLRLTFARRARPSREIVARAIARGDLPTDTDLDQATELFAAPMVQRSLFAADHMDMAAFRAMHEIVRAGLWARSATPPVRSRRRPRKGR